MIISLVVSLICCFIVLSPFVRSVLSLGGVLICVSLLITVFVSYLVGSWFAFILFLVYVTGLLVLFSYMVAMSPNTRHTGVSYLK